MPLKSTPEQMFRTVGVTQEFHQTARRLAAAEDKRMWQVLDELVLPLMQKRLTKLNAKAAK